MGKFNNVKVILQRHGEYYGIPPDAAEAGELIKSGRLGRLTEQGEETVRKAAKQKISEILRESSNETDIEIAIFYSPSAWFGHKDKTGNLVGGYGIRARDSAKIVYDTLLLERKRAKINIHVINYAPNANLEEANIFFLESANDPKAYFNALRNCSENWWWEEYCNGAPSLENLRKQVGAESPKEISERIKTFVKTNSQRSNDSKLIVWGITHCEVITCFVQYGLNNGKGIIDKYADCGEILEIDVSKKTGSGTVKFRGEEYEMQP